MSGGGHREPAISLVVPAYNEAARLPAFLRSVRDYFDNNFEDYEIIVVDDGSDDETTSFLEGETAAWQRLSLVRHLQNQGKGSAIRTGMAVARGALLLFADADGATPIEEEKKLRAAIALGADLAVGSRRGVSGVGRCGRTRARRFLGHWFMRVRRLFFQIAIDDTQCGFKMFRSAHGHALFESTREAGYLLDIELLVLASARRYRVAEVAVDWSDVPGSKIALVRDSISMLFGMFQLWRRLRLAPADIEKSARSDTRFGASDRTKEIEEEECPA